MIPSDSEHLGRRVVPPPVKGGTRTGRPNHDPVEPVEWQPANPEAKAYWAKARRFQYLMGYVDEDGTGRGARAASCPRCHSACITGLDGDVMAFTVWADPEPINALQEWRALASGRATWDLTWRRRPNGRGRYELDERLSWTIAARSADTPGRDVLAQHRCWPRIGDHPAPKLED